MTNERDERANNVSDPAKTPALRTIPKHRDGPTRQRLVNECGHHHSVVTSLPRADGVEQSNDDGRQHFFSPVGERQKFVESLGAGVAPTSFVGSTDQQIVFFTKRKIPALAIDFGSRCQQNFLALLGGEFEKKFRGPDIGFNGSNWRVHDQAYSDGGREMEDCVDLIDQFSQSRAIQHRVDDITKTGMGSQVLNVLNGPGGKVIDNRDLIIVVRKKLFGQMRADESCSSCNQISHVSSCLASRSTDDRTKC